MDFREYSELYHYGVKGMHWGIRRYQNYDGTTINKKKKTNASNNKLALENIFGKDNKVVNKILNSNGEIRKTYIQRQKARTDKERAALARRSQRLVKKYLKEHGKEPMSYEQSINAQKGAAIGTALGIAVPIILPLWATIPAGYYIGSKIKTKGGSS